MSEPRVFRGLDDDFFSDLIENKQLSYLLDYERKKRREKRNLFIVEIRDNFLDLYFLGHGIVIKKRGRDGRYFLSGSNTFNPEADLESKRLKALVKKYGKTQWQIYFDELENRGELEKILDETFSRIVDHRKGAISEGVSEINHVLDNRDIGRNGVLIIDRQVVFPGTRERIDLLGIRRLPNGKFAFSVVELKNKNNLDIGTVFSQTKRYIDIVFDEYESFVETYKKVIKQKKALHLLKRISIDFAHKNEIAKRDILGVVILDNFNIKSDLKEDALFHRALRDWESQQKDEYTFKLFLKTNVLDDTFFLDYHEAKTQLDKLKAKEKPLDSKVLAD